MTLFALFGEECRLWSIFDGPHTHVRARMGHFLVDIDDATLQPHEVAPKKQRQRRHTQQEPGA
jgi:hypothetical protein